MRRCGIDSLGSILKETRTTRICSSIWPRTVSFFSLYVVSCVSKMIVREHAVWTSPCCTCDSSSYYSNRYERKQVQELMNRGCLTSKPADVRLLAVCLHSTSRLPCLHSSGRRSSSPSSKMLLQSGWIQLALVVVTLCLVQAADHYSTLGRESSQPRVGRTLIPRQ